MKNYKRYLGLLLLSIILISTFSVSFAQNEDIRNLLRDEEMRIKIEKLEKEIDEMEKFEFGELKHSLEKSRLSVSEIPAQFQDIGSYTDYLFKQHNKEAKEKEKQILLKYDFQPIRGTEDSIDLLSSSTDMTFTESNIYYDSSTKLYRYTSDWLWKWGAWDEEKDIDDLVGVGITKPNDYLIYSSFAKTWDNAGYETGYVDNSGNHTPSNSYITKRFEDNTGVCFNVNDKTYFHSTAIAFTHKGRVTVYLKKLGSTSTKILMTYDHNYKTGAFNTSAKISSVGFTSASGVLEVSYSKVNKQWRRSSGGKIIQ